MHIHTNMPHPSVTSITLIELIQFGCTVRTLKGYDCSEVELDIREVYADDAFNEELDELLEDPHYWELVERPSWERY